MGSRRCSEPKIVVGVAGDVRQYGKDQPSEIELFLPSSQHGQNGMTFLARTAELAPDLQLPSSYRTAALIQLARQHTAGQATEAGQVNALASWLSAPPFRYSLSVMPSSNAAGLLSFLTTSRTGYCVQYASAMTVLTRLLGIPARLVTGLTLAKRHEQKAHVWAEAWVDGQEDRKVLVCQYPDMAAYKGSADINDPANYSCKAR